MKRRKLKVGENIVVLTKGIQYWNRVELYPYDKLTGRIACAPNASEYVYVSLDPKSTRELRIKYSQYKSEYIVLPKWVVFPVEFSSVVMEVE